MLYVWVRAAYGASHPYPNRHLLCLPQYPTTTSGGLTLDPKVQLYGKDDARWVSVALLPEAH